MRGRETNSVPRTFGPAFLWRKHQRLTAFTLIELLVAMAVLALVLVLMLQVVDNIMRSTRVQNQQMDSAASARRAMDILEADLRAAVISRDAGILAATSASPADVETSPGLSFLTQRRGPGGPGGTGTHRFLAVAYATNDAGELRRAYQSVPHAETNLLQIFPPSPDSAETVADGILQWKVRAVTESGEKFDLAGGDGGPWATNTYNGLAVPGGYRALVAPGPDFSASLTNRTRALEVWIAATDKQSHALLSDHSGSDDFLSNLAAADPESWRGLVDASEIPLPVKTSTRILQKTIPLP